MKILSKTKYEQGFCIDILKFQKRSFLQLVFESLRYKDNPSLMFQIGPNDLLYTSVSGFGYIFTLTLLGRHYDD